MNSIEWNYTSKRGICTTFLLFYILLVMVENSQSHVRRNIQNGTNTYPWQASLHYKNESGQIKRICSAALISKSAIITAAHCTDGKSKHNLTVIFGNSSEHIGIKTIKLFDYSDASNVNDLAVLIMKKPTRIVPGEIQPIKLDHELLEIEYEENAYFKSYLDNEQGTVELKELSQCWVFYPGEMLCGVIKSSKVCNGDSGGIVWIDNNGEELAIGIISYGLQDGCTKKDSSVNITKLKYYNIHSKMQR